MDQPRGSQRVATARRIVSGMQQRPRNRVLDRVPQAIRVLLPRAAITRRIHLAPVKVHAVPQMQTRPFLGSEIPQHEERQPARCDPPAATRVAAARGFRVLGPQSHEIKLVPFVEHGYRVFPRRHPIVTANFSKSVFYLTDISHMG